MIQGEHIYIVGKVSKVEHCAEAFGYSFEKMVLYAWSLGIGTTMIGGTMKRELFEQEAKKERHDTVFPQECRKVYEISETMFKG